MTRIRAAYQALVVVLLLVPSYHSAAQNPMSDVPRPARVIFLTRADNAGLVKATVGQIIQIDLQTLASAGWGSPQVSTSSVRYENQAWPMGPRNPGGHSPIFIFTAVSTGEAEIRIPRGESPGFSITAEVQPGADGDAGIQLDQAYSDDSRAGSTNLVNHAVQTFTPSLAKLVKVEFELVELNSTSDHKVTLTLLSTDGQPMEIAEKDLAAGDPGWVSFLFADGGADVTPGEVYGIEISGGNRFGWKYAEGGYGKGEALFNGKPILKGAHASFLFKTFGSKSEGAGPLEPRP